MSKTMFRFFNPGGPKEDAVEKRRGQLRRAQQSYRDRRDKYTKALEEQMGRTRANEANLMRENARLRDTIQMLLELISQHEVHIPAHLAAENGLEDEIYGKLPHPRLTSARKSAYRAQLQAHSENTVKAAMPIQLPLPEFPGPYGSIETDDAVSFQQNYQTGLVSTPEQLFQAPRSPVAGEKGSLRLYDADLDAVGMDFVLKIERPCLGHLHGDPKKPNEPAGHALTASAQLLMVSSVSHEPFIDSHLLNTKCKEVPAAMLHRLLDLAPTLTSDDEVTPIQVWNHVRQQPYFGGLEVRCLLVLAEKLQKAVRCKGFGAVIELSTLENLIFKTLILGREL